MDKLERSNRALDNLLSKLPFEELKAIVDKVGEIEDDGITIEEYFSGFDSHMNSVFSTFMTEQMSWPSSDVINVFVESGVIDQQFLSWGRAQVSSSITWIVECSVTDSTRKELAIAA